MASLFPGMDPFLERADCWPAVQHHVVAALYQLLLPGLVDRYRARVGRREYATETPLFTSVLRETQAEEFLEIRARSDDRLVTLVEVVSLANRTTPAGRVAYLAARQAAQRQRAGVVEIDLVTQGTPTLDYARADLPAADYVVAVARGPAPDRFELYAATVAKRLPKFRLPLAADDRDTVVDLQTVYARAADQGQFANVARHAEPLPAEVVLTGDGRAWAEQLVRPAARPPA